MQEIKSSNHNKTHLVKIDGIPMEFKAVGAGSELAQSQRERRITYLSKKLEAGTITELELDKLDMLEDGTLSMFSEILGEVDGNQAQIDEWIRKTPTMTIIDIFKTIRDQIDGSEVKANAPEATEQV